MSFVRSVEARSPLHILALVASTYDNVPSPAVQTAERETPRPLEFIHIKACREEVPSPYASLSSFDALRGKREAPVKPKSSQARLNAQLLAVSQHSKITKKALQLIAKKADPNAKRKDGTTALMLAAKTGSLETVQQLLAKGADPNRRDSEGHTALSLAVRKGKEFTMLMLLGHGADVNLPDLNGKTPLMCAAELGKESILYRLIEAKADVNAVQTNGKTALMGAASFGNSGVILRLAQAGADVNAIQQDGTSALMVAAKVGELGNNCLRVLIGVNANHFLKDEKGNTAGHYEETSKAGHYLPKIVELQPLYNAFNVHSVLRSEITDTQTVKLCVDGKVYETSNHRRRMGGVKTCYFGDREVRLVLPFENFELYRRIHRALTLLQGVEEIAQIDFSVVIKDEKGAPSHVEIYQKRYEDLIDLFKREMPNRLQRLQMIGDLLLALKAIHNKKMAHGDIKPANILIDQQEQGGHKLYRAKLADFDGAVLPEEKERLNFGTKEYYSPELIGLGESGDQMVSKEIVQSSDIWALGLTCLYLWTGKHTFQGAFLAIDSASDHALFDEAMIAWTKELCTREVKKRPNIEEALNNFNALCLTT